MPNPKTEASSFKQQAHALIDQLPGPVSWDDLAYRQKLSARPDQLGA